MAMQPVDSSAIAAIGYNAADEVLCVRFRSGREHEYWSVPPDVYQALLTANSIGRYFNAYIKDCYHERRVR